MKAEKLMELDEVYEVCVRRSVTLLLKMQYILAR